MLLTLIAIVLSIFPPKISDGFAIFLTLSSAIVYSNYEVRWFESYLKAMLIASIVVFGNFFGVPSYVIASSLLICEVHFILEMTKLRRKFISSGYGALLFIFIYTSVGAIYFHIIQNFSLPYLLFLSLIGGLSASLVEYVKTEPGAMVIVASTTYLIFTIYVINTTIFYLAEAFAISFILALISMKTGVADESGLLSATLIGTIVILFTDIRFFTIILTFYIVGSAATKYMYKEKYAKGVAEPAGGARGYVNVFSNSLAALFFAINYGFYGLGVFKLAFLASVATALGDTVASEIGKTSEKVYLITNFKRVEPGTNGGISIKGEIAAIFGCLLICIVALVLRMINLNEIFAIFISSFIGVHIDSLLGATLEEKGWLTNAGVNFIATLSGGLICLLMMYPKSYIGVYKVKVR